MSVHEINRQNSFSLSLSITEVSCRGSEETTCQSLLPFFPPCRQFNSSMLLNCCAQLFYDYICAHFTNALEIKHHFDVNVQHFCFVDVYLMCNFFSDLAIFFPIQA